MTEAEKNIIELLTDIKFELKRMNDRVDTSIKNSEIKAKEGEGVLKGLVSMIPEEMRKNMGV